MVLYIFCLYIIDILQGRYRKKHKAGENCTSKSNFLFNLKSMALEHSDNQLSVEKSLLRAYMKFNSRWLEEQEPAIVTVEVYMKFLESNDSKNVLAGTHSVPVTAQFSQWVEINVTEGIRTLGLPTVDETNLEVTLILSCQLNTPRVPAIFINPATIPLSKALRRKKKLLLQPFLLVHLSDERIKAIVRNESIDSSNDVEIFNMPDGNTTHSGTRKKRDSSGCHIEEFFVNFNHIAIKYIQSPVGYNAKQCSGSCTHDFLSLNGGFGNNHAKIMAGARKLFEISSDQFTTEPKGPCCVPTSYSSMTVIEFDVDLKYRVYPSMVVEACGCR